MSWIQCGKHSSLQNERCYASHCLWRIRIKTQRQEGKLIESRTVFGLLLRAGVLRAKKSDTGDAGEQLLWAASLTLGDNRLLGKIPNPQICLSVRRLKDQPHTERAKGMGGPHWSDLLHFPPGHELHSRTDTSRELGECKVPFFFFFFKVFLKSQAWFYSVGYLLYNYEIVISFMWQPFTCIAYIGSFICLNSPLTELLFLSLIYLWENWDTERFSDLLKAVQLVSCAAVLWF